MQGGGFPSLSWHKERIRGGLGGEMHRGCRVINNWGKNGIPKSGLTHKNG